MAGFTSKFKGGGGKLLASLRAKGYRNESILSIKKTWTDTTIRGVSLSDRNICFCISNSVLYCPNPGPFKSKGKRAI